MDGGVPRIECQQRTPCRQERSPAWARDGGRRHFFILTNDRGPCCLDGRYRDVGFMRHHIIANGERSDAAHLHQFTDKLKVAPRLACHDTAKDLAIPTPNLHYPPTAPPRPNATARADGAALPVGAAGVASTAMNRSLLIFFAGDHPTAECRHALVQALGHSSDAEVLVRAAVDAETYAASLRRSRYCPICGGFAPWTPRIPEVIDAGCVPIFMSEYTLPPFDAILDWPRFSATYHHSLARTLPDFARSLDHVSLSSNLARARSAMHYHLGGYTGLGVLPLIIAEMARLADAPIPTPPATPVWDDVDVTVDYTGVGRRPPVHALIDVRREIGATRGATRGSGAISGTTRWECTTPLGTRLCSCERQGAHVGHARMHNATRVPRGRPD